MRRDHAQLLAEPGTLPIGKLRDDKFSVPTDPWTAVWGQPKYPYQAKPYDRGDVTTLVLPEAFTGKRPLISQTIEREVYLDDNWHVRVVMPFGEEIDGMVVTWNETIFKKHVATPTPELGVVRLVESKRMEHEAAMVRYGVGYYMEHGFMSTKEGIMYHMEKLRQLAQASLEAIKFDVIVSLLQAGVVHRKWEVENNVYKGRKLEMALNNRVWMFAAMQKHKRPLNLIDTRITEIMNKYGGRADTWIMPPQLINYLTNVPDEYLSYKEAGSRGPDIVFDRAQPFSIINKNRVFVSRSYETEEITGREEIMSQRSEVGEFYVMADRFADDHQGYTSRCRNIQIYDQDGDRWHTISAMWALDHSYLFKEDGKPLYSGEGGAYDSGFTGHDQHEDIFNYFDNARGEWMRAEYMGELRNDYFTTENKLEWARAAARWIDRTAGADKDVFTAVWNAGLTQIKSRESSPFDPAVSDIGAGYSQLGTDTRNAIDTLANSVRQLTYNPHLGSNNDFYREFILPDRVEIMERTADGVDEHAYDDSVLAGIQAVLKDAPVDTSNAQPRLGDSQLDSYKSMMIAAIGRLGRVQAKKTVMDVAKSLSGTTIKAVERDAIAHIADNLDAFDVKTEKDATANIRQFSDHFNQLWTKYENTASGTGTWRRTGMLASPTWLATLANHLESGGSSRFMPVDPDRRDIVMRRERLIRDTAAHPLRQTSADEQRAAFGRISQIHPAFHAEVDGRFGIEARYSFGQACSEQLIRQVSKQQGRFGAEFASEAVISESRMRMAASALGDSINEPVQHIGQSISVQPNDAKRKATATFKTSAEAIAADAESALIVTLANAFDAQQIHRNAYVRCIKHDLPLPLSFVITRPHMAYNMLCAVKCLSGYEMGRTVTKPAEFEIQDDAATHAHLGTLIFYAKSVVTAPKHVFVAREIYANGCLGGAGVGAINPMTYKAGSAMRSKVDSSESLIVIAMPYNYEQRGIFSLTGSQIIGEYAEYDTGDYASLAYPTQARYNHVYGWNQARRVDDYDNGPYDGMPEVHNNNVICFQGHTFYYLPRDGTYRIVQLGTGHWGADGTYLTCKQVRNGELEKMKTVHWENYIHA